jgi:hypothetical protein
MTPKGKVDLYEGKDPRAMPAYGITEAAHYLQIPRATLHSWLLGRHYETEQGRQFFKPLIDLADKDHYLLSFFNLVEAHVLNALRRKHQVSLAKVRAALDYLRKRFPSYRTRRVWTCSQTVSFHGNTQARSHESGCG